MTTAFDAFDPFASTITASAWDGISVPVSNGGITGALTVGGGLHAGFVKGEMLLVEKQVDDAALRSIGLSDQEHKDIIKKELAMRIAEEILKNKMVEFTKVEDIHTGVVTFKARAYLVTDDKIREIRKS
jgi:hypothetical protein